MYFSNLFFLLAITKLSSQAYWEKKEAINMMDKILKVNGSPILKTTRNDLNNQFHCIAEYVKKTTVSRCYVMVNYDWSNKIPVTSMTVFDKKLEKKNEIKRRGKYSLFKCYDPNLPHGTQATLNKLYLKSGFHKGHLVGYQFLNSITGSTADDVAALSVNDYYNIAPQYPKRNTLDYLHGCEFKMKAERDNCLQIGGTKFLLVSKVIPGKECLIANNKPPNVPCKDVPSGTFFLNIPEKFVLVGVCSNNVFFECEVPNEPDKMSADDRDEVFQEGKRVAVQSLSNARAKKRSKINSG